MKVVLGIDNEGSANAAVCMLDSLGFPNLTVDAVHVLERLGGLGWSSVEPKDRVARYLRDQEVTAEAALARAVENLKERKFTATPHLLSGFVGNRLIEFATESAADLVALGATEPEEAPFSGTIAKKILIGARQSVLVAKGAPFTRKRLTVVFATDHSEYSARCATRLLSLAPQGIERLVVLTAYPKDLIRSMEAALPNVKSDVASWVEQGLRQSNAKFLEALRPLAPTQISRIEARPVVEAIDCAMQEEKADLLILGAQGHGFIDRHILGSVSMHVATARPHSVLVLRV